MGAAGHKHCSSSHQIQTHSEMSDVVQLVQVTKQQEVVTNF